ncbi:MAG: hypothetical protein LBJ74_02560, partial [Heliobacteriaceae bacterium]|nr:hypothetical protein [Heliobacteriaceae bacterium]
MNLNDILLKFGGGNQDNVYMSITPGLGLEVIQLDIAAKSVKNYAYRPLEYNESLREIADYEKFKTAVKEVFDELGISYKSYVILNIPMVLFGSKDLPLLLADDAITEALTSEVEQSYIFKRFEPLVSWIDSPMQNNGESRKLFYSAVQKNQIENIKAAFNEIGASLIGVEISLTSVLKALSFANLAEEQLKEGVSWNLMLINPTGYSIVAMSGSNIVDYYEEPLAIKSFEGEEVYNAINASLQITLMSYPANYLYIISETDMVSAELLSRRLSTESIITTLENNEHKKQELIPTDFGILRDLTSKISLEAIGVATGYHVNLPVKFNFAKAGTEGLFDDPDEPVTIRFGETAFTISPNKAKNLTGLIAAALLIPALLLTLALPIVKNSKQNKSREVQTQLDEVNKQLQSLQSEQSMYDNFDVNTEIKKILVSNRTKLMAYTALGEAVTKNLWLTYFMTRDD